MTGNRFLVVNADDFGRSPGVNRGVIEAHERGIVTSASLMVRYPAAVEAARYTREGTALALGLHVDLGEWIHRNGEWEPVYELEQTAEEVRRQLGRFRALSGRDPTHLDSHQHVHRDGPVREILDELAGELGVPLRHVTPGIAYCGAFYGQTDDGGPLPGNVTVEALVSVLAGLPAGVTELCCHPAAEIDFETAYAEPRLRELATLCAPEVRSALDREAIELRPFGRLPASAG